ncbi:MAG TPA: DUF6049 family protein [Acidimicrobiales bacterium]|jgi:hypothetical protein|nr:DUF6049 family protein [Acidimicrobiales bacterium]
MRWGRTALCSLAAVVAVILGTAPAASGGAPEAVARATTDTPPLTLVAQTNWVTPDQPWFNVTVGVSASEGSAAGLRVSMTYYSRLDSASQLQQAIDGTPGGSVLGRYPDVAVTSGTGSQGPGPGYTASACVTVLRDARDTPPTSGTDVCAPGSLSIDMGCTPLSGTCGDVYPVAIALYRQNSTTPVARLTTFLTYQEAGAPGSIGRGGPLNVGLVLPDSTTADTKTLATALADHPAVPTTLAMNPAGVQKSETADPKATSRALAQLGSLDSELVLAQPYEPIDLAAMSEAKIPSEITAQMTRGDEILHAAGLRPTAGPWVDTTSSFAQGDSADLAAGLQEAGSTQLVMSEGDLTSAGLSNYTFAQPFNLDLGHGSTITAVAADSSLSARFTADPNDPVLSAEQLLAGLFFVHFENASLAQARGVVIMPPANWRASTPFLETLLDGLSQNDALKPVALDQLFGVPVGGNREPAVRHLQGGPATHGISHTAAVKIALARQQLSSYTAAISGHVPSEIVTLSDALLATEAQGLSANRRAAVLTSYEKSFATETGRVSLAGQETVTFTARQASIPITVLSSAPYPVNVVVTLASDKFTFPNGNTRHLTLDRPTTSVRVTAQARTSGDRLPIDVTLHTPNGQLLLAHTVLTVHSTAISFVGVALTILAGAVLLLWWARTWLKARRKRLRAT